MKIFLIICLVSRLASSEKLDRSYLPPPGSQFSGGTPGDIDVPLEFPKQPTGRPQLQNGKPEIELGINQRPAQTGAPGSQKLGSTYFKNSYPVPKTTTSYAITQTTTFPSDFEIDQPNAFVNGSNAPGVQGQNYPQPIRGHGPGHNDQQPIGGQGPAQNFQQAIRGQGPSYNQNQPGVSQSTLAPYGTTARPPFATFTGPQYLPPVSNKQPSTVISNQDGSSYGSDLPQGSKYQDGETVTVKRPSYTPGIAQQNHQNVPSTVAPQYQNERFGTTGFGSQETPKQLPGSQFSQSTTTPQYQAGQRFLNPGSNQQNLFLGNQDLPSSTAAPQFQGGQRLFTPGSNQKQQFSGNRDFASSTPAPQFQIGQGFTTPGLNQKVFGSRIPNQQNQYSGNQLQGNQLPSSTLAPQYQSGQSFTTPGSAPTPASIQNQYSGNQNYPSTAAPNYQDGQRFTTPGQIQGLIPGQRPFGSRLPIQNKYPGQNLPSSTIAPQYQDSKAFTTPGYIQEGYGSSVPTQPNENQYPGSQSFPSPTTAPQYQSSQQFTTGPDGQNFPTTAAPTYQNGQGFSTPGQYQGQLVPEQQFASPNLQGSSHSVENQIYPSSTIAPQYQGNQRLSIPGSQQRVEPPEQNQYGNQNFPTSTAIPQYQDQRFSTPGQIVKQPAYPGSTTAPQYQQTFAPSTGGNQLAPSQQNQFQRPVYNQKIPSTTAAPQSFVPGSQLQFDNNNLPTPGTEVAFSQQGLPGSQSYGNNQQPVSQPEAGSSIYGPAPSFSNQKLPSTTVGSLPARDFTSTPGFESISGSRPYRPQAEGDRNAEILNYENVLTPEGYFYSYDTSNGIHADETGVVDNGTRAQGGYTYTGDDGKVYSVVYTADENGFQPRGDHLPTPPPIPEAIQRVIDQANMDKEAGIDDDGSYNEEKYGYMKYEGPLTRLRSKNKTVALVNGADIPERSEDVIDGQNRRLLNPKSKRPGSKSGSKEEIGSQETDTNDSHLEDSDMNEGIRGDDNLNDNKEVNRRPSAKSKPAKNLSVKDNMPDRKKGIKTPTKPLINSKKDSNHLQISTEEYEDNVPNDSSEEFEDNEDVHDSDDYDVDLDQVNYKDDPNNRTDFHGLNKYLPESKKTNRKNQSGKKRPNVRVNSINKPRPSVTGVETNEDRYSEQTQGTKPDFDDKPRTRIPARKNKIGQKVTGQTVPRNSDDETNAYDDGETDTNENYDSDNTSKPLSNKRKYKPTTGLSNNRFSSKSKRPTTNKQEVDSNNKDENRTPASYEETGYEYNPPQRKFPSGINQKGQQTTVRPFLNKNVNSDENEPTDEYIDQYGNGEPGRPTANQNYPGYNQGGDQNTEINGNNGFTTTRRPDVVKSSRPFGRPQTTGTPPGVTLQEGEIYQNNPEVNQNQGFSTTRTPTYGTSQRPFGRPQVTLSPHYKEQSVAGPEGEINQNNPEVNQNEGFSTTRKPSFGTSQQPFGRPQTSGPLYQDQVTGQLYVSNQGPQKPEDKLYYNTHTPNRGTVGSVFSTTPLPPSGPDSSIYQSPGQYHNIPTGGSYYEASPSEQTYVRPGQVPSTTYRPNYSFGDKISSVTVDASGRPIQSTSAPAFDHTLRPTYSARPENANKQVGDRLRPNQGRFGVTYGPDTSGYQSTSAPIGEDFSGPKQPQRFDPETGYHYK